MLGTARTSNDDGGAAIDGVPDGPGRIRFQIPADKTLALGRHRLRLVVSGDHSATDLLLDVVAKRAPIVVSDVDGTLTSAEAAEYPALLTGSLPDAQPNAAKLLDVLASKGYRIVYLTARPEWLTHRTHEFLAAHGFPAGIVHTTTTMTGALGGAAVAFKSAELDMLGAHDLRIAWAFGNQPSDNDAYEHAGIDPRDHRVFLGQADTHGGRTVAAYSEILPTVSALPNVCR